MIVESSNGLSFRTVGEQTVERLNARWGVRLDNIINNEALSLSQRRHALTAKMLECALLEIDEHNWQMGIEEENPVDNKQLIAKAIEGTAVELEPNISFIEKNFKLLRNYEGQQVKDFIVTFTKRFESMSNAKTPGQLAIEILSSSALAIGTAMAKLTVTAWRGGATLLAAIKSGVIGVGIKTAVAVIIIILAALLLYLFLENPKKILAMIINDTHDDLVVTDWRKGVDGGEGGNLWLEHGRMENFPEDHANGDLDSPMVQIRKRAFFAPGDEDNVVFAGFYFGARNFGLRGVEGVMVFTSATSQLKYAHMFAVPYVNDNGTNMRVFTGAVPNLSTFYRELYNARKVRVDVVDQGVRMTSTVDNARGGVVGLIASISKV